LGCQEVIKGFVMSVSKASKFLEKRILKTLALPVSKNDVGEKDKDNKDDNITVADSEVRRYILFYVKGDEHSRDALEKLKKNKALCYDTHVQNAATLGKRKPWWLDGVPTLFDKSRSSLLKGSSCIEFIEQYKKQNDLFRMPG
jgi:hypothetical protein